jgi:predicted ester cyclase
MTANLGSAQEIAGDYARAWLAGDAETALSYIADDVVCEAPSGQVQGLDGYRQFLAPFVSLIVAGSGNLVDVLGNDDRAATVYTLDMPFAKDFRGAEYLTVNDGKITRIISVFDLSPMAKAGILTS